jgi:hypothetical protein
MYRVAGAKSLIHFPETTQKDSVGYKRWKENVILRKNNDGA